MAVTREQVVQWANETMNKRGAPSFDQIVDFATLARADLSATVAEQAKDIERLKGMVDEIQAARYIQKEHNNLLIRLAASQAYAAQLREALIAVRDDLEFRMQLAEDDSLNISNSVLDQMLDAIDLQANQTLPYAHQDSPTKPASS